MNQIPKITKVLIIDPNTNIKQGNPKFTLEQMAFEYTKQDTIIRVLYFSIDPVMRVWYSGAKTSFSQCQPGKIFNCFAIGQVIQVGINKYDWELGNYVFGNTGTASYVVMEENKRQQIFQVPTQLVNKFGPAQFLYLINNGLAAYSGVKHIINNCKNIDTKRFIVSTGAGATGLLVSCLLYKLSPQAHIISLTSSSKISQLKKLFPFLQVIDYQSQNFDKFLKNNKFHGYFDNVGQKQLDLILKYIENKGAIALCGAISNYNSYNDLGRGLRNYQLISIKQLNLKGINFTELIHEMQQAFGAYDGIPLLIKQVKMQEFQHTFNDMLKSGGGKLGKYIVKL